MYHSSLDYFQNPVYYTKAHMHSVLFTHFDLKVLSTFACIVFVFLYSQQELQASSGSREFPLRMVEHFHVGFLQ